MALVLKQCLAHCSNWIIYVESVNLNFLFMLWATAKPRSLYKKQMYMQALPIFFRLAAMSPKSGYSQQGGITP